MPTRCCMYADFGCRVQLCDNNIIHEENNGYHFNILLVYCERVKHQLQRLEEENLQLKRLLRKYEDTKLENEDCMADNVQFRTSKLLEARESPGENNVSDCENQKLKEKIEALEKNQELHMTAQAVDMLKLTDLINSTRDKLDLLKDQSVDVRDEQVTKFREEFEKEKVKLLTLNKQNCVQTLGKMEEMNNSIAKLEDDCEKKGKQVSGCLSDYGTKLEQLVGKVQLLERINGVNAVRELNGRNLIKNPCGDGDLKFWNITSGGWDINNISFDANTVEQLLGINRCFGTLVNRNFTLKNKKIQTIDLIEEGFPAALVDEMQPDIYICDWFAAYNNECRYKLTVDLLNVKKEIVKNFTFQEPSVRVKAWSKVEYTFKNYGRGVRYIRFQQIGHYYIFVTNSRIRIQFPQ